MNEHMNVLSELRAYQEQLGPLAKAGRQVGEQVVRQIDGALDRASEVLGDDTMQGLISPEAAMSGDQVVWAEDALLIVSGVIARLDPPRPGRVYSPDVEGPKRTW